MIDCPRDHVPMAHTRPRVNNAMDRFIFRLLPCYGRRTSPVTGALARLRPINPSGTTRPPDSFNVEVSATLAAFKNEPRSGRRSAPGREERADPTRTLTFVGCA